MKGSSLNLGHVETGHGGAAQVARNVDETGHAGKHLDDGARLYGNDLGADFERRIHDTVLVLALIEDYRNGLVPLVVPITLVRHMGGLGQSSEPSGPSYDPDGLLLDPGYVELSISRVHDEGHPVDVEPDRLQAAQSAAKTFIDELNVDEQVTLVALMWIGRGTYEAEDLEEALSTARSERVNETSAYLLGVPLFLLLLNRARVKQ